MNDFERKLRDLGERLRQEAAGTSLSPTSAQRIQRRRAITGGLAGTLAALLIGAVAWGAVSTFDDEGDRVPAPVTSQPTPVEVSPPKMLSVFIDDEKTTLAFQKFDDSICYLGNAFMEPDVVRIEIVDYRTEDLIQTLHPSEAAVDLNGKGGRCLAGLDPEVIRTVPKDHGFYLLLVEREGDGVETYPLRPHQADPCYPVGFEPTYVPTGWEPELQPRGGGGSEWPGGLGHYGTDQKAGTAENATRGFIDLVEGTPPYVQGRRSAIEVLGSRATIGLIHEGYSVEFSFRGCNFILLSYGPSLEELELFAEGLRETQATEEADGDRCLELPEEPPEGWTRIELWFMDGRNEDSTYARMLVVQRDIAAVDNIASTAVEAWIAGPTRAERRAGAVALANPDTRLLGLDVEDGIARVDVSDEFHATGLGTYSEGLVLASLVGTLTQFTIVERVMLYTNGEKNRAWGGHGGILDPEGEARLARRHYRVAEIC